MLIDDEVDDISGSASDRDRGQSDGLEGRLGHGELQVGCASAGSRSGVTCGDVCARAGILRWVRIGRVVAATVWSVRVVMTMAVGGLCVVAVAVVGLSVVAVVVG